MFLFIAHPKSLSIFKFFTLSKFCWNYIRFHVESINYLFASYITLVLRNYYDFHTCTYTIPFLKYRWFYIHLHCPYFNKVLHKFKHVLKIRDCLYFHGHNYICWRTAEWNQISFLCHWYTPNLSSGILCKRFHKMILLPIRCIQINFCRPIS